MEIEKIRFEERLNFTLENQVTSECYIPTLLLQPLIENSFKHGVAKSSKLCRIILNLKEIDNCIEISLFNDRVDKPSLKGTSIGLENTRKRLEMNFDSNFTFDIDKSEGFEVRMRIPIIRNEER